MNISTPGGPLPAPPEAGRLPVPRLSTCACLFALLPLYFHRFWEGGESPPCRAAGRGRKVRTPEGAMPRNSAAAVYGRRKTKIHAGGKSRGFPTESATENQTAEIVAALCERRNRGGHRPPLQLARVKRCGKSAPREAQATRHGKPHRVQGQIGNPGAARSSFRESETDSGYRLLRQMILSAREGADRIRLTALPKPIFRSSRERRVRPAAHPLKGKPEDHHPGERETFQFSAPRPVGTGRDRIFWMAAGAPALPTRSTALTATTSGWKSANHRVV